MKVYFFSILNGSWPLMEMLIVGLTGFSALICSAVKFFFSTLLTVKIGKTNSALPAVFAHSHSARHKARFNHFFPQVGLTFCFDKINYRSRLFLSFSLLAAFISRLPRASMRVSAVKNASALLLLLLRSPGFSRRPASWQLPHHIAWRLKGPHTHTLHVLHAWVILLLGFLGGWDCLQPQVFSLCHFFYPQGLPNKFQAWV